MSSNGDGRARLVHETRKTIKRMRALARLLRRETGEREFHRVNDTLREAARALAGARDAAVLADTLSELREQAPDALAIEPVDALLARLRAAAAAGDGDANLSPDTSAGTTTADADVDAAANTNADPDTTADTDTNADADADAESSVLESVGRMRGELLRWSLLDHEPEALAEGLRLIYRDGRRRYRRVKRTHGGEPQLMHDWRKRVKALYYALDMLGAKKSAAAGRPARQADRLGDLLGREHDLWMLGAYVQRDERLEAAAGSVLRELIERRRAQLRRQALAVGAELYREKSKRFAASVGRALRR